MTDKVETNTESSSVSGNFAVLGMDIVAFSKLHDDDQITAIEHMSVWIEQALAYFGVHSRDYRWSPAGDGGYLTFVTSASGRHAIDVGFSILEKAKRSQFCPRNGDRLQLRLALHSGTVREGYEVGRAQNIWGMGINMAARVLSVAASSQLLVSKQYYDTYIQPEPQQEFSFGDLYRRTVKHGAHVEVMNAARNELGLSNHEADDCRWQWIGGLWEKTRTEYELLIHDAMHSGQPIAAIAAAKFLLDLEGREPVRVLCSMIGSTQERLTHEYPARSHEYLSLLTPEILEELVNIASARPMRARDSICRQGDVASSFYFTVAGTVEIKLPGRNIRMPPGSIIGEFGLWIENIHRTATVEAEDDGLLLCFQIDSVKDLFGRAPHVANRIHDTVRLRVLDNVLKSSRLFPMDYARIVELTKGQPCSCDKYASGIELDLTEAAYVIFSGLVQIEPEEGTSLQLSAVGNIGDVPVVGVLTSIGRPDGATARVLEETVAVRISHEGLRALQNEPDVRDAWNALYGRRLGELQDAQTRTKN